MLACKYYIGVINKSCAAQTQTKGEKVFPKKRPFALVAKSFEKPSETFIRQHATLIAPGRTALLSTSEIPPDPQRVPGPIFTDIGTKAYYKLTPEKSIRLFLKWHRVRTVLAEYGPVGEKILPLLTNTNTRLFVHFHGYDASSHLRRPGAIERYQKLFQQAAGFFVPSQYIGNKLIEIGCPSDRITVSPCGVDTSNFVPSRRLPGKCLSVGRFVEKKSPLSTLKAFLIAAESDSTLHLDMVGEGPLLDECRTFAADHPAGDRVVFHGAQSHGFVKNLMSEASMFLQHSVVASTGDCEGLPVAILEAMSSGIPVVSTYHSGIPEAVTDGEHGYLVDEHDVSGMSAAILQLARTAEPEIERMSLSARRRVETHFSAQRSIEILQDTMGLKPAKA